MTPRLLLLCILLVTSTFDASAATFQVFKVWGIRDGVILRGKINEGDDEVFRKLAVDLLTKGRLLDEVRLYSPGGSVGAAIGIGRQIYLLGLATRSPITVNGNNFCLTAGAWASDKPETGPSCTCASACALIWMAGQPRIGHVVGVHAPRYEEAFFGSLTMEQAQKQYAVVQQKIREYLKPFDIPEGIMKKMYNFSSSAMYFLSPNELLELRNIDPALYEYETARCGELPTGGTIFTNPAIKKWADCDYPLQEARRKRRIPDYLKAYNK